MYFSASISHLIVAGQSVWYELRINGNAVRSWSFFKDTTKEAPTSTHTITDYESNTPTSSFTLSLVVYRSAFAGTPNYIYSGGTNCFAMGTKR